MPEVIGIDHIYITVSNMARSEAFYDAVMSPLGFRKNLFQFDVEKHIQYYNRHFGYVIRPARIEDEYNPYTPGLHHLCLRVEDENDVLDIADQLKARNIEVSEPKYYPEYAPDYFAIYISDPPMGSNWKSPTIDRNADSVMITGTGLELPTDDSSPVPAGTSGKPYKGFNTNLP